MIPHGPAIPLTNIYPHKDLDMSVYRSVTQDSQKAEREELGDCLYCGITNIASLRWLPFVLLWERKINPVCLKKKLSKSRNNLSITCWTIQVRKIPWRKDWLPTPVFLPGKSHGQRSLVGYSPRGHKEPDTTEQARILRLLFKTGMLYLKHLLLLLSHFSRVRLCATP